MLKVSDFSLEKQTSFIPKKICFEPYCLNMPTEIQNMAFAALIFSEGFDVDRKKNFQLSLVAILI